MTKNLLRISPFFARGGTCVQHPRCKKAICLHLFCQTVAAEILKINLLRISSFSFGTVPAYSTLAAKGNPEAIFFVEWRLRNLKINLRNAAYLCSKRYLRTAPSLQKAICRQSFLPNGDCGDFETHLLRISSFSFGAVPAYGALGAKR